jgi:tripartite-type tricarboxylate transporter receptor subunit TctC
VTGRTRWHDLPEIPTMLESGYPDFVFETYTAFMTPARTPPEIISRLEQVALDILRRQDMREKLTQAGFEVTAKTGKEHMARVAKEVPMFAEIIAQAGIKKL